MNTDIRISVSFRGHRKRKRLKRILGEGYLDYLIDLWLAVSLSRPRGNLNGWSECDIADEAGWNGDPEKFTDALVKCGWLDVDENNNYSVHDWGKHNSWACGADERSEKARVAAMARWRDK